MKNKPMFAYLCGPISGLKDLNCPAFNAAAAHLRALGFEVLNPAELTVDFARGEKKRIGRTGVWRKYMYEVLRCIGMHQSEVCIYLPRHDDSRGATSECLAFSALELPVVPFVKDWTMKNYRAAIALASEPSEFAEAIRTYADLRVQQLEQQEA